MVAAASPLLRETMSQDPNEEIIISVPEITSAVMAAMMDLLYKGRMYITPSNTWAIRSLVEVLRINAEDVSVISGSRASMNNSPSLPLPTTPITTNDRNDKSTRKRRRESADEAVTPVIAKTPKSKISRIIFRSQMINFSETFDFESCTLLCKFRYFNTVNMAILNDVVTIFLQKFREINDFTLLID